MPDYDNNMRGVLFPVKDKRNDGGPDYSGHCEIEGREFWLDGWKRKSKSGNPFLSIAIKPKKAAASRSVPPPPQPTPARGTVTSPPPFDDDIPF